MIISEEEFRKQICEAIMNGMADVQTDLQGQLVIYTGMFEHNDTTIHTEEDPAFYANNGPETIP